MRRTLTLFAFCACVATSPLVAQHRDAARDSVAGSGMGEGGGMMNHSMMMRMDSLGARLDSLTRAMNRASGPRKVDAMAEVLTALVGQHLEMQRHMHERMMGPGGEAGKHSQGKGGMDCPSKAAAGDDKPGGAPQHNH